MLEAVIGSIEVSVNDCIPSLGAHHSQRGHELPAPIVNQVVKATVLTHSILHECFNLTINKPI